MIFYTTYFFFIFFPKGGQKVLSPSILVSEFRIRFQRKTVFVSQSDPRKQNTIQIRPAKKTDSDPTPEEQPRSGFIEFTLKFFFNKKSIKLIYYYFHKNIEKIFRF